MKYLSLPLIFIVICITMGLAMIVVATSYQPTLVHYLTTINKNIESEEVTIVPEKYPTPLPPPEKVKGIYLTGYTFSNSKRRAQLIELIESTELNSMVIDLKDPAGKFMFKPLDEKLNDWPLSPVALDYPIFKELLDQLQQKNIYTIARMTTFQDPSAVNTFPHLALKNKNGNIWRNWQGIAWLDMTNQEAWDIALLQAMEAATIGFDEIQFDYIRFPSDGNIGQINYHNLPTTKKKYEVMRDFFHYTRQELNDIPTPLSIDLFGLTYQRQTNSDYDMNIGQRLVDAAMYFDFISPMVYPSHYPTGFLSLANPVNHPYAVVNEALKEGNLIMATVTSSPALTRPWLQDFNLGAYYDASMVKAQIQASDDNNSAGWLLWNPSNVYTVGALQAN